MRNGKSTTLGVIAMAALLAAAPPATTRPAGAGERTITITLPGGPVAQPGPDAAPDSDAAMIYVRLTRAAGLPAIDAVQSEVARRLGTGGWPRLIVNRLSELAPSLADGRIDARISVEPTRAAPPGEADQFADAATDVIRERVNRDWDEIVHIYKESLPKVKQEAADATAQLAKARQRVADGEAKLRDRTGRIDLSPAGIQAAIDALELERQKVELDVAGLKARREGLQMAIAEQSKKADAARNDDAAAQALAKAVEVSKTRLAQMRAMYQSGNVGSSEVSAAELAVMQAEAQLAERRNAAGGSTEALAQWNRALTDASIEQREKEARLKAATTRLAALADATALQEDLDAARAAEASAAQTATNAEQDLRRVTAWLDRYGDDRPTVTVRRATPPTTAPAGE